MQDDLTDRIYEAAFLPECWDDVLARLSEAVGSASGCLLLFDGPRPLGFAATGPMHDVLDRFCKDGLWQKSRRVHHFWENPFTGFVTARDYFKPEFLKNEPEFEIRHSTGLDDQAGTLLPMPSGEIVVFAFDRAASDGVFEAKDIALLNAHFPHLARTGLISARLRLERAQATVSALDTLALPAAVIGGRGRVIAANAQFEKLSHLFLPIAFGGVAIADAAANRLFQEVLLGVGSNREPLVRSIPVRGVADRACAVIHMVPLRRGAHDIFSQADILIIMTEVRPDGNLPPLGLLSVLFDLAPAEARLAIALSAGKSLKAAAAEMGIEYNSARTYLTRIFTKTGTSQQSQLVALLKSTR